MFQQLVKISSPLQHRKTVAVQIVHLTVRKKACKRISFLLNLSLTHLFLYKWIPRNMLVISGVFRDRARTSVSGLLASLETAVHLVTVLELFLPVYRTHFRPTPSFSVAGELGIVAGFSSFCRKLDQKK